MSGIASSMSNAAEKAAASIVNGFSSGGPTSVVMAANGCKEILSGALSAGVLATVLSVTGGGVIDRLALYTKDATARTLRLQVVLDGVTAFDSTSASTSTTAAGIIAIGTVVLAEAAGSIYSFMTGAAISFNSSCVIKVASDLTETDKIAVLISYRTV